ncbi:hypothetical protein GGF43_004384, partial [Coemansia sp. RSA 2618]
LSLRKWKDALRLLSVSAAWRAAGLARLYRVAFIADIKSYRFYDDLRRIAAYQADRYWLPTPTNTGLIERAGLLGNVKHVVINGKRDYNGNTVLAHIISIMELTIGECPGVDALKTCSQSEFSDYNVDSEFKRKCHAAICTLSQIICQKYPHARRLTIDTFGFCNTLAIFSAELSHRYLGRLSAYAYKGISYFPQPLCSELTHLDLTLYRFSDEPLPRIHTHGLRTLRMHLGNIPFSWSLFHAGAGSNIEFDCLEHLSITYDTQTIAPSSWCWTRARLPQLRTLCVSSCHFSQADIRWLLATPLTRLQLVRSYEPALDFMPHDLSSLDELSLAFIDNNDDPQFIARTNDIFARAHKIPRVCCELFSDFSISNAPSLDWPLLTRLRIHQIESLARLLLATLRMPRLAILEARFGASELSLDDREGAFLSTFAAEHPQPTESLLEKLALDFNGAEYTQAFTDQLLDLKRYFSKLHVVTWNISNFD